MERGRDPGKAGLLAPLAAPVVWAVCFLTVYLFAEAACAAGGLRWAGADAVVVFTIAATGAALVATVGGVWWAWRAGRLGGAEGAVSEQQSLLSFVGLLLAALFTVAIVALAAPALVHRPC